ncbi:hypothetical protein Y900_025475 [Mycolicibacterium aromaticivorans JS19b1 = JCM 16368]|uniref:Uncharacterized protein n=1 Tax=Mycolicibacterium aromaticivorans JS19b1 = JCM 16368 TaxID=1440774 RepID=A0A064CPB4_9MYCO|nr:hypothetical protein Y900_025475 [Mycolicibacterium aromaticivorans JS19b1 = JCM 16368]
MEHESIFLQRIQDPMVEAHESGEDDLVQAVFTFRVGAKHGDVQVDGRSAPLRVDAIDHWSSIGGISAFTFATVIGRG